MTHPTTSDNEQERPLTDSEIAECREIFSEDVTGDMDNHEYRIWELFPRLLAAAERDRLAQRGGENCDHVWQCRIEGAHHNHEFYCVRCGAAKEPPPPAASEREETVTRLRAFIAGYDWHDSAEPIASRIHDEILKPAIDDAVQLWGTRND